MIHRSMSCGQLLLALMTILISISIVQSCRPDWDNQCDRHEECCSNYCHRDNPNWRTGVCKRGNRPTDSPPPSGDTTSVSEDEFMRAVQECGFNRPTSAQYRGYVNGFKAGSISSKREAAMALAQFVHESGGLVHKREWACREDGPNPGCQGHYQDANCDIQHQRYYGRGYIQLTWCSNYRQASLDLLGNEDLRWDADRVARDEDMAWGAAFWYWKKHVHSEAETGQFGRTTRVINGQREECQGNGRNADKSRKRFEYYTKIFRVYGISGQPDERGCNY